MEYVILVIALFVAVGKNIISKAGGDQLSGLSNLFNLNIVIGALALIVYALFGISFEQMSDPTYIMFGIFYAIFAAGSVMFNIVAMKYAPVALCSLVFCAGFIITTLYCAIFLGEDISVIKAIGMVILIASIVSVVYRKSDTDKKTNYKFLLFSIPAMLSSGFLGITQKEFAIRYGNDGINSYLFLSFGLILLIFLIARLSYKPREIKRIATPKFIIPAIIYAAIFAATNKINLYLATAIDGVILFPFLNGGAIALTAILSYIIFKEKLNLRQWLGTACCIGSIIMVALG